MARLYWVIVEGPDNIGKTTLIDFLEKKWTGKLADGCIERQHFGSPIGESIDDKIKCSENEAANYAKYLVSEAKKVSNNAKDKIIINDRSIFGELVYGKKYRKYNPVHLSAVVDKLRKVKNLVTIIVSVYGNTDTVIKFKIKDKNDCEELYAQPDEMDSVSCAFIKELHALKFGKLLVINSNNYATLDERNRYIDRRVRLIMNNKPHQFTKTNSFVDTPFNVTQRIFTGSEFVFSLSKPCNAYISDKCDLARQHKDNCKVNGGLKLPILGYGVKNPQYVFFGEVGHFNTQFCSHIPFYNSVSGNLLQQTLHELDISPFDIYISNVIKCTPQNNMLGEFKKLSNIRELECVKNIENELRAVDPKSLVIFTLGTTAYNTLEMIASTSAYLQAYAIVPIAHPSYYLRHGIGNRFKQDLNRLINQYISKEKSK